MQANFTWESEMFRCSLCMNLYSESDTEPDNHFPVIVCSNIHTICHACLARLRTSNPLATCPTCRCETWKTVTPNRDLVNLISQVQLACGSCDKSVTMSNVEAILHAQECMGNNMACPMLLHDTGLTMCCSNIKVKDMWQHCQQFHNAQKEVQAVNAVAVADGGYTACFSLAATLQRHSMLFCTATTPTETYHWCVNVLMLPNDSAGDSVAVFVRRVFPALAIETKPTVVAVEVGMSGGFVLHLEEMVSCHTRVDDVLSASAPGAFRHTALLPMHVLRQMHDPPAPILPQDLKMTISVQIFFQEKGGG